MKRKSKDRAPAPKPQTPEGAAPLDRAPPDNRGAEIPRDRRYGAGRPLIIRAYALIPLAFMTACASSPMTRSGSLSSYQGLAPSNGAQTKSEILVDKESVLAAKTVRIAPTRFADRVGAELSEQDRALVANAVDRALCKGLSSRLEVVDAIAPADLSVRATITHLGATSRIAAGASVVVGFIPSALTSVPGLSPRVPFGLGSLTIEAEALNPAGGQEAAIVWSRGANYVMSSAMMSEVGDAYQLASDFGGNFGELVTRGETPFGGITRVKLPKFGGKKDPACEVFGRGGGLMGKASEFFGMPPGWTDKGAQEGGGAPSPRD